MGGRSFEFPLCREKEGLFKNAGWVSRAQNMNSVPDPKIHCVLLTNLSLGRSHKRAKLKPRQTDPPPLGPQRPPP